MTKRSERAERNTHPGWAVKTKNGEWLGGAHGWFLSEDAFYADIYESEEDAKHYAENTQKDFKGYEYNVVPAWEPLCEHLRAKIASLKAANTITPHNIMNIVSSLEDAIFILKGK